MLISGEPNMGLRNLRNILNSDPNIELLHFTILRPPTKRDLTPVKELALIPFPSQELFSADMSKFNLIILKFKLSLISFNISNKILYSKIIKVFEFIFTKYDNYYQK